MNNNLLQILPKRLRRGFLQRRDREIAVSKSSISRGYTAGRAADLS